MRGWVLAALVLGVALAGCLGALDSDETEAERIEPAGTSVPASANGSSNASEGAPSGDPTGEAGNASASADDGPADLPDPPDSPVPLDVDPTKPGGLDVERRLFDFGYVLVTDPFPGQGYPVHLNGSVHYPASEDGPFPLVVFIHGRHATCRLADDSFRGGGTHVCPNAPPAVEPIDSWKGYGYIAETLASHGFVVASINANDVNDRDFASFDAGGEARAELVIETIDAFARANQGENPSANAVQGQDPIGSDGLESELEGRVDLDRVGLMGHSRGGEGVARAVTYDREVHDGEHDIDAVFAMAPIDFTDQTPSGVDLAVLLPYCDGDVFDLQGAHMYDRTRFADRDPGVFKVQILTMGANHNFYNSVWAEDGSDADWMEDPYCGEFRGDGGGRLSAEDQQRQGEALVNGFFLASLDGERRMLDWFADETLPPKGACPTDLGGCEHLIHTTYHPPAGDRLVLDDADDLQATEETDLGSPVRLERFTNASVCEPEDCPGWNVQGAGSLTLTWEGPARYTLEVPDTARDVSDYEAVTFRAGVNEDHDANTRNRSQEIAVELADEGGSSARVSVGDWSEELFYPPGDAEPPGTEQGLTGSNPAEDQNAKVTLDQARVPLQAFAARGVALDRVQSVALVFGTTSSGSVQVNDVMLVR